MSKIDTSIIEGYESMSAEEKVKALEALEYSDGADEIKRLKAAVDKASSDAASWKRKHNELLSAEDKAKQEHDELFENMKAELETLKREKTVSENKSKLLASGYSDELAQSAADALSNGDLGAFFEAQKKFIQEHDSNLERKYLDGTPRPGKMDGGDKPMTKESFAKLTTAERFAYSQAHPDEYKTMYEGD